MRARRRHVAAGARHLANDGRSPSYDACADSDEGPAPCAGTDMTWSPNGWVATRCHGVPPSVTPWNDDVVADLGRLADDVSRGR